MADAYATARTYVDHGTVNRLLLSGNDQSSERLSFRTLFERPHKFRYEFTEEATGQRLAIWQKEPPARRYWTVHGRIETTTLASAIASATGISSGSALSVPNLLMPSLIGAVSLADIDDVRRTSLEPLQGVECVRLDGRHLGTSVVLWIGADDLLIRMIHQKGHFGSDEQAAILSSLPEDMRGVVQELTSEAFDVVTETRYSPEINGSVKQIEFEDSLS
jgi:hypothetical protein